MNLEDKIKDRFLADTESILDDNIDALDGWFKFHEDGTINLGLDVRELGAKEQILIYLIARRYASETTDLADSPGLDNDFFYSRLSHTEGTIRNYQKDLRDKGLIKSDQGMHKIVVENMPGAIDKIRTSLNTKTN